VAQNVRRDIVAETGVAHDIGECFLDAPDRLSVPLYSKPLPVPLPASQMRREVSGQGNGRLTLLCLAVPRRTAIEHATIQINPATADDRLEGGTANRTGARSSVERGKNEACDMLP
jgi:hypothetical protein